MKNMILHIAITTLLASMSACSDEMDSVLTQRDWDGTATYFQSADEHGFSMYYKPQVALSVTRCHSMIRLPKTLK